MGKGEVFSTHLRQNFLYSEDVINKLFVLPYLNEFLIFSFDDVNFAITLFWAKKSQNLGLLGEEKIPIPKNSLKSYLIMCFN